MWQFADLQTQCFFRDLQICDWWTQFFKDLNFIRKKIFLFTKKPEKCSESNLYQKISQNKPATEVLLVLP